MIDKYQQHFAHFEGAPLVDFYGVLGYRRSGWVTSDNRMELGAERVGKGMFHFEVWRGGDGKIQNNPISIVVICTEAEWIKLRERIFKNYVPSVLHFKAKLGAGLFRGEAQFVEFVGNVFDDAELNEYQRQLAEPIVLNSPPLPEISLVNMRDDTWRGLVVLPSWQGFHLESVPYQGDKEEIEFPLNIPTDSPSQVELGYRGIPPLPEQVAAYVYLTENDHAVQNTLLQAIWDEYADWQADYLSDKEYMPDVNSLERFRSLLRLRSVEIFKESKKGYAYVCLILGTNWDPEHNSAAILHKDSVIELTEASSVYYSFKQYLKKNQD